MSTKHPKTIVFISIGVLGFLLFGFWMTLGEPTAVPKRKPEKRDAERWTTGPPGLQSQKNTPNTLEDFQKSEFYRMIVDNNLFRPLGWTPPRPREPYRLLGTILSRDANTPKQAILQKIRAGRTYTVTIGEILDENITVTDIQSKQVTLKTNEQQRTLILNTTPFLK